MGSSWICFGFCVILGCFGGLDCSPAAGSLAARQSGDFMFGGLFPIHQSFKIVNTSSIPIQHVCENFTVSRLVQSLMMIEAVEAINNESIIPNLKFGYEILDTCSDVTTALQHADKFMDIRPGNMFHTVIGEFLSEVSIAVARFLTIDYMPQISYGSTAGDLSDKKRFPTFKRTVPEDDHQAQAITQILSHNNWTWIGIIITDGDYGRYAADRLEARAKDQNISVSYRKVLSDFPSGETLDSKLNETIKQIEKSPKVQVIVSFASPHHMSCLFDKLTPNASGRFWIAGDSWATSVEVLNSRPLSEVGKILGITLFSGSSSHFMSYLENLELNPDSHPNNTILQHFLKEEINQNRTAGDIRNTLKNAVNPSSVFSIGLAIRFVANAIKDMCSQNGCNDSFHIQRSQLNDALAKTNLTMDAEIYRFSQSGDLDTGYDIKIWEESSVKNVNLTNVARYTISNSSLTFLDNKFTNFTSRVISRCSETCLPGTKRVFSDTKPTCCYVCEACPPNTFSNKTNADECFKCSDKFWSEENSTSCSPQKPFFLSWKDKYCITILVFASLGLLLTLIVMFVFLIRRDTPVVLAAGGPISFLILLSLLGTFTSAILFGGKPTDIQCKTGQVLFGLSFTLCVSCILSRYFKILMVFRSENSTAKLVMNKIVLPYWIIAICMLFQAIVCGLWLFFNPPKVSERSVIPSELIIQCAEGDELFFGLMLGLIGLLAVVCFGFAFLGRKLPECYNEEKCISFSMLIYIISWVVFGPIYVTNTVRYKTAIQMVVMLFSAYGILICHFMPKCYIILFKSKHNTRDAFKKNIREYNRRLQRSSFPSMGGLERTESSFTFNSGIENILNRPLSNHLSGTFSSLHLSLENLPHEVSVDSVYGSSLSSGSSEDMNEENQRNVLSGSQKLIIRIKKRQQLRRTLSVP